MVGVIVMKNIDFDGDHIMWMVVSTVAAAILWLALIIKSYYSEQTEMFLKAGCEQSYVAGRTEQIWTNCKKPLEIAQ